MVLTDSLWEQLQAIMRAKGCKSFKNNRNVMECPHRFMWSHHSGWKWSLQSGLKWSLKKA
jgi:hypothetical protein